MAIGNLQVRLGEYESVVRSSLARMQREQVLPRIWQQDHTVWKSEPTEISNRLGWLHCPETMAVSVARIEALAQAVRSEGLTDVVLLGMGGSSLAPEVFGRIFGAQPDYLKLTVLDSTVPDTVLACANRLDLNRTLFISSTKSGTTVETISLTNYFYNAVQQAIKKGNPGHHFFAITDPNSHLETLARQLNFRKIFLNDPTIGGRFSALSLFGLVPAGLLGMDLRKLLERARLMAQNCRPSNNDQIGDAAGSLLLGVTIGELAGLGRDKLTIMISPSLAPFGAWLEQLIAESTGKEGMGILPVVDEEPLAAKDYADDRLFVFLKLAGEPFAAELATALVAQGHPVAEITLRDNYDLGGEFFRWEMATAIAGHILKVNPFDQPNVEQAKALARNMVREFKGTGKLTGDEPVFAADGIRVYGQPGAGSLKATVERFFEDISQPMSGKNRSYAAIQAFIPATLEVDQALQMLRRRIQVQYRLATTVGYGPRFLHSTGQLHKGDGGNGRFIQITADFGTDVPIPDAAGSPDSSLSFGVLALAQAMGDFQALRNCGRKVIRFHISGDISKGLMRLVDCLPPTNA
ncbi:MAG: glucose-6-phosphate isomerase [candidate division KSB1 bacterium]|nr:glucose-6-phosphate isomerase [candidate division KSB1 bacterium]MDZ7319534.1 glucose-6-phosphate isomerase [candidate division KSB1 bacterium]MDZ7342436.1 glucose-6-phosphate isomerase [candidate division KSB1 bacterium]